MKIGLLNNLRAGRSAVQTRRLLKCLEAYPDVRHVETSHAAAVPEALGEFARQGVDLLVVNGGDGTLMRVLTEILGSGEFGGRVPMIAPLRGGRTNMSALDIGSHRDPVRGLTGVLSSAWNDRMHERVVSRRVLRVEYGPYRDVLYGMFFGTGVIHRGIDTVHRVFPSGRSQGVFGATLLTSTWLGRMALLGDSGGVLAPDKLQLMLDDEMQPGGEYTLAMACTLKRLFAGMRPFWGKGDGGVPFTSIESGAKDFWKAIPGILAGRPSEVVSEANGYCSRKVDRALIGANCGFTVDGELVEGESGRVVSVTASESVRFVRA
jgi:diacylglycerol kinase (ATP)